MLMPRATRRAELQAIAVRLARTLIDEARCLPYAPLPLLQEAESAAKGIIYCRSKALCDEIAGVLGCLVYYADMEGSREEVLDRWQQEALGHGRLCAREWADAGRRKVNYCACAATAAAAAAAAASAGDR
ncbi:hypothetical protein CC86DRAFT_375649 [Ophiobolus disseminans]|uniref:Uncharacterized protein n=1 Tax=Ophiobolus disseminans TaxID=1469910 RepID=A0A6A6ZD21_9PLEO|nr:hypothetical protein CC86DRAFT_375649 [Ophiobolus disseminans]